MDFQAAELADACRDANGAEQATNYYLDVLMKDTEVIAVLERERDALRRWENEALKRAPEILSSAEKDRNLKLAAEQELVSTSRHRNPRPYTQGARWHVQG